MAIKKDKKVEIIKDSEDIIKNSNSLVFLNFHKLPVLEERELRKSLRKEDIGYKVIKKTLFKRALDDAKIEGEIPEIKGELAVAYGKDLLAPAREVYNFQKTHKENVQILGGIFEKRYMDGKEMLGIATIPPLNVLYGKFVNVINSPIAGLVMALGQIAESKASSD